MATESIRQVFEEIGAIRQGHFILPSGLHTSEFWEKFVLLQHPQAAKKLVAMIAERYCHVSVEYVAGPALGGVVLAYELAHQLHCQAIFVEKTPDPGVFVTGRGVTLEPGTPTILIDDFVSTGRTLTASVKALQAIGADVKHVLVLVDRCGGTPPEQIIPVGYTIEALLEVNEPPNIVPEDCPLCKANVPLINPKTMKPVPFSRT